MNYTFKQIEELEKEYSMALYCFDSNEFAENYIAFTECFRSFYSKYQLAYSYKTNYTPAICKLVKKLGGYAEVVSDMEYKSAKKLGYENSKIIYNGPCKGELAKEHLINGGILNVDSLDELYSVCAFIKENPNINFQIGLRINITVGQPFISRFGIDAESDELNEALGIVDSCDNLEISGLHCHISQARGLENWKRRTETMLAIADKIFTDKPPKYLDFGSGMFGKMEESLEKQFSNIPSYYDYAMVTAGLVQTHYKELDSEKQPILFTEPGTTVINKYVDLIVKVVSIKHIKDKCFIVVNGSCHNIGEICKLKKIPMRIIFSGKKSVKCENADIVGYTCLEHDVIYEMFSGEIAVGDYIVFGNVGGYSNVTKPPFINPNCAMIEIDNSGKTKLIKRIETMEDIFSTYIVD